MQPLRPHSKTLHILNSYDLIVITVDHL